MLMKASRTLGFIVRNTHDFNNSLSLKGLYIALIRSILECGSVLRNPYQSRWINKIECVQNKFHRYINSKILNKCAVIDRNQKPLRRLLNINTLNSRRIFLDVVFVYKIVHGSINDNFLISLIDFSVPSFHCRNRSTFYTSKHRALNGFFSTINRVLVFSNYLYKDIDFFHSSQVAIPVSILSF